jgi:hypothetical protein
LLDIETNAILVTPCWVEGGAGCQREVCLSLFYSRHISQRGIREKSRRLRVKAPTNTLHDLRERSVMVTCGAISWSPRTAPKYFVPGYRYLRSLAPNSSGRQHGLLAVDRTITQPSIAALSCTLRPIPVFWRQQLLLPPPPAIAGSVEKQPGQRASHHNCEASFLLSARATLRHTISLQALDALELSSVCTG